MTRKELHDAIKAQGYWHTASKAHIPLWIEALALFKKETGEQDVNLQCGGCINKIKNWLEK